MQDLPSRTATGAAWVLGANVLQTLTRLLMAPVLARLLAPETFGSVQMVLAVIFFAMTFNEIGIASALVRDKTPPRSLWASAFWIDLGIGVILSGLVFLSAKPVAALYQTPAIVPIMQVSGFVLLAHAVHLVPRARLQRDMRFAQMASIDFVCCLVAALGCIAMAYLGAGVWSLVGYQVLWHGLRSAGYWLTSGFVPAWQFDHAEVRRVLAFSLNLFGTRLTLAASDNFDKAVLGRVLGAGPLGYYGQAYQFMLMPIEFVVWGLVTALIPAFSRIQDDLPRIGAAYLKCVRLICLIMFPAFAGACVLADPIVEVLLGKGHGWDWSPVAPILAILAPVGAVRCVTSSQEPVLFAIGRTDLLFRIAGIQMAAMLVGLFAGLPWGVQGVATGYAIVSFAIFVPLMSITLRQVGLRPRDLLRALLPFAAIAIGMAIAAAGLDLLLVGRGWPALWRLLLCVPVGAAIYGAAVFAFENALCRELLWLALGILKRGNDARASGVPG